MHGVVNLKEIKNELHSLLVNYETNLMLLINPSLEHVYCSNYCSNLVYNHNLLRLIRFVS